MDFFDTLKMISPNAAAAEKMSEHTSFKIGGDADFMVFPKDAEEIKAVIELCREHKVPYMVMGNGSNMLVSDEGIEGVVIKISDAMAKVEVSGETVFAGAGILLSSLSHKAMDAGLSGLEFASGIPGTLGGAVVMNAGAYGGEMKDVITKVGYMDKVGKIHEISGKDAGFGYRKSIFSKGEYIVLYCEMKLKKGDKKDIAALMADFNSRRKEKQPLNMPSAGSTFKRPEGYFAGKLIEDSGLKGMSVGGAKVSEKHSGFVVNYNNASAEDVKKLISDVQDKVEERFGVRLEPEIKFYGR